MGDNNGNFYTTCGKLLDGKCYRDEYVAKFHVFDGCFPRGIKPSDADGVVEIKKHVLILEFKKSLESVKSDSGQMISLRSLSEYPCHTVMMIECDPVSMRCSAIRRILNGEICERQPMDLAGIRALLSAWAEQADRYEAPTWLFRREMKRWLLERGID